MDSSDKLAVSLIAVLAIILSIILLGAMRKDAQDQECRLTAMTYGIPSAEIIQLCK